MKDMGKGELLFHITEKTRGLQVWLDPGALISSPLISLSRRLYNLMEAKVATSSSRIHHTNYTPEAKMILKPSHAIILDLFLSVTSNMSFIFKSC